MNFSTTVINPSYLLAPSVFFFVALIEILPVYDHKILSYNKAYAILGFSIGWILQLHMSWVLMPFFVLYSFFFLFRNEKFKIFIHAFLFFIAGFLLISLTTFPAIFRYGLSAGNAGSSVAINVNNFKNLDILTRFFSFSSFDVRHFINGGLLEELDFMYRNLFSAPFIIILYIVGLLQIIWCIMWLFKKSDNASLIVIKKLVIGAIILAYLSYLFAIRNVATYTFYLLLPLSFIYSFYTLQFIFRIKFWKKSALFFILAGLLYHATLAKEYFSTQSLYSKRDLISKALKKKDSRIFAFRRIPTWERLKRESSWQCEERISNGFKTYNCKMDFDNFPDEIKPEALNSKNFKSPPYALQLDTIFPSSILLSKEYSTIINFDKVQVNFDLNYSKVNQAVLVISEGFNENIIQWNTIKICEQKEKENEWHKISLCVDYPALKDSNSALGIMVWYPDKSAEVKILLDNFNIQFLP